MKIIFLIQIYIIYIYLPWFIIDFLTVNNLIWHKKSNKMNNFDNKRINLNVNYILLSKNYYSSTMSTSSDIVYFEKLL